MFEVQTFTIELDEPLRNCVRISNSKLVLSGKVELVTRKDIQLKSLSLQVIGKCFVKLPGYREVIVGGKRPAINRFLVVSSALVNSTEQSEALIAGTHTFPFTITAQANITLPHSAVFRFGYINYALHAKLMIYDVRGESEAKVPFVLLNSVAQDVTQNMQPKIIEHEGMALCWCCASGPVIAHITLSKTAIRLRTADTIDVSLMVDNLSNIRILPRVYIVEKTRFYIPGRRQRKFYRVLQQRIGQHLLPGSRGNRVELQLGPLFTSVNGEITSVVNIFVTYEILVQFKGCFFKISCPLKVLQEEGQSSTTQI